VSGAQASTVAQAVGTALARRFGVSTVFGVVGSGNFLLTSALAAAGARFVAARHEGGAAVMADAYARVSGELGVLSVHQGPGLTNAMTGIAEAAKSRTPLLILAAEATSPRSNFHVDQSAIATAVGAQSHRVTSAATAADDLARAWHAAARERRTVLLSLPLEVQAAPAPAPFEPPAYPVQAPAAADPDAVKALADALARARRPVFLAGRGARHARKELIDLSERTGALLATSAVSRGLFRGEAFNLDVSGGFATPVAARLIQDADLLVGWGCSMNMWTLRHGALVGQATTVVQIDIDPGALGAHHRVDLGLTGEVATTARAVADELRRRGHHAGGYRSAEVAERLAREGRWRDVPYQEEAEDGRIDPRTLSAALDDLLPAGRTVAVDSGNFMGYPSMYLDVPDPDGFVFTQGFQSIGLGLSTAIGAAVARPDRLTVAALGDGGALMGISELETAVRLGLDLLVVVYDDEAYGAEVHHFGAQGHPVDIVTFPPADIAAIGAGFGCAAATVRAPADLTAVADWLSAPRTRPMLVDAKVTRTRPSWWLEEAFRGH
jgi:thiamine pyrophosphate-dependent acetolactate synthase large subunit-like protein